MPLSTLRTYGPAPPAAVYSSITTGFATIQAHAKVHGYAFFKRDSQPPGPSPTRVIYACDRSGKPPSKKKATNIDESRRRKGVATKKYDCKMRVALKKDNISGQWELHVLEGNHNHEPSADPAAHPAHRNTALDPSVTAQIDNYIHCGLSTAQILITIRREHPSIILAPKDISNRAQKTRLIELDGKTPME